ncbi:MAG: hypothetical protein ACFN4W_08760 [Segatella oris]
MKRSIFILLVLCLSLQVEAQSYRHQVRWSIGVGDEPHLKNVRNDYVRLFKLESDSSLFSAFQNINVSLSMEYLYHLNSKWAVGAGISYTEAEARGAHIPRAERWGNNPYKLIFGGLFYSIFPDDDLRLSSKTFTFMPAVSYTWLDNGHFALYSRGGLGVSYYHLKSNSSNFPNIKEEKARVAYQLSPVGIEIGSNHLRFTSELGYGLQGIWNVGLVWHFGRM